MIEFYCYMVFVDDSETPVYIWGEDAAYNLCSRLILEGHEVEIFGVFR